MLGVGDQAHSERWLFAHRPMPSARVRLFCFPYGGGGASAYRHWQAVRGDNFEVCPVQLRGRENRYAEPAVDNIDALVDAMLPALHPLFDRPVAFLGDSMGAAVAYTLAARCADLGHVDLRLLIGCARKAPPRTPTTDRTDALPDPEFIDYVVSLGGTDPAVFEEPSLWELALPPLRADFRLSASLVEPEDFRLSCRVVAIGGREDASVPPDSLVDGRRVTCGSFDTRFLPGGHFFLNAQTAELLAIVRDELSSWG